MQGIEFEEDKSFQLDTTGTKRSAAFKSKQPSILTKLIFKAGVNDPVTANYILLGIAVFFFGIAVYLYTSAPGTNSGGPKKNPTAEEQKQMIQMLR